MVDSAAGDTGAVKGDAITQELIRDRFAHLLHEGDSGRLNGLLAQLRGAADADQLANVTTLAWQLRDLLAGLEPERVVQ